MKILMFGWEFPPHISGGLGTACYGITTGLLKQGLEVIFVVPSLYGDEDNTTFRLLNASEVPMTISETEAHQWSQKLSYIEVQSSLIPYVSPEVFETSADVTREGHQEKVLFSSTMKLSGKYGTNLMMEVMRYAIVASEIAKNNDFDVIHAHDWLTFPAGIAAKEATGKPFIAHIHATEYDRSGDEVNPSVYKIEKAGLEAADKVIAVSERTRNTVINKYGIHADKVAVAYNGVISKHNNSFLPRKSVDEKIVTFMGRITYQKGPEYFVEAARKVLNKHPETRFVMAGSGDMMTRMINRVAELKMSSRFHFTGFLSGEEVHRMYAMSDVYIMPSVSEPFGIAPLEAMQSDVPVIISRQSGVAEVLKHAIQVDFWDVNALADAISGVLRHRSLSTFIRKNGQSEIKALNWDSTGAKIKNIYESLKPQVI